MVDREVEGCQEPLALVLPLVGHQLPLDDFAELLLGELPDLRTLFWGAHYTFELCEIFHPRDRKIGQVGPLEEVVNDPDFLRVVDCEALGTMYSHRVSKSPVITPFAIKDFLGIIQGHPNYVIEDELFLLCPAIEVFRPWNCNHDVLSPCVLGAIKERHWQIFKVVLVALE